MYLDKIVNHKRKEIPFLAPFSGERHRKIHDPVGFLKEMPVIAEIKKASPSEGMLHRGRDVSSIAVEYQEAGAGAVSVLTDSKFFHGDIQDMAAVSEKVNIPVLCKDFILDDLQVENAYRAGAEMVLLIAAVLDAGELKRLSGKARSLGLAVLYEIHTLDEFKKIEDLNPGLVGINARNLETFSIDISHTAELLRRLDGDFLKIAESGITGTEDIELLKGAGADAYLVGTLLMRSHDPSEMIRDLNRAAS